LKVARERKINELKELVYEKQPRTEEFRETKSVCCNLKTNKKGTKGKDSETEEQL